MNFASILNEYFVVTVMIACLIVGYLLKNSITFIPNKYIPTILTFLGAVLNLAISGLSINSAVFGALMGLASTGTHQAFTKFIENKEE